MEFTGIDFKSRFYKNCVRQRKNQAKICDECTFRRGIEQLEFVFHSGEKEPNLTSIVERQWLK